MTKLKPVKPQKLGGEVAEKYYPSLHLSDKDLPAIKKWKVGKTYNLTVQVRQTSLSVDDRGTHASFEIRKIAHNDSYSKELKQRIRDTA